MSTFIPALSKHSPDTLIALMDRFSQAGINKMREQHRGTEDEWQHREDPARGFFEMAKRTFPRLS
ncbi:MAG: hypothetical protein LIP23_01560, partial [Planctomycetes bacterium]|nr:hypothetical protein [Planctomycetota bacterium]